MSWYYDYKPYVPVAQRRAQAAKEIARRLKGAAASPVVIEGRKIAVKFWGEAWCTNLESYSDFANRLPRGRTYVRNGSVVHLTVEAGRIDAYVSGSELYTVRIDIEALPKATWKAVKTTCAGQIGSLVELLQGKLSDAVMKAVTDRDRGLFPKPREIKMTCSCPDYAGMCKHIAAVLYGIGSRLDSAPELLFALRGVDHRELIEAAIPAAPAAGAPGATTLAADDLGAIFDIELGAAPEAPVEAPKRSPAKRAAKGKKAAAAKSTAAAKQPTATKTAAVTARTAPKKKAASTARTAKASQTTAAKKTSAKPTIKKRRG